MKWTSERTRLLCCNRLVEVKRVDLVIRAFIMLARQFPKLDLVIAGSGDQERPLRDLVPHEFSNRVIWMGQLQLDDVISVYCACDAFVLASSYEPWAAVISEAAACGLPIVASDVVGAAHEVFEDKVGGRLFRSGDLNSLTECLRDVLEHLDQYRLGVVDGLKKWRQTGDPVNGIREALQFVHVLPRWGRKGVSE
jgi:glycosyltransferase involved in cell wall biosynthesis